MSERASRTESSCRACGAAPLSPILSLGETPLANRLLDAARLAEPEPRFPLDLVLCPACSLVQITETVSPEVLFGHYLYESSFSSTMLRHAEALVDRLVTERGLGAGSLALEVASNDGYLLQHYVARGVPVLGIEPAHNIAELATKRGIRTRCEFFGFALAAELAAEGVRADVIHANNVLAHVADLPGVARGFAALLAPEGSAVIEVPHIVPMIDRCEFDTIYHEHLCYFSLTALVALFERHELVVQQVEELKIHGGSLRLFVQRRDATRPVDASVARLMEAEARWGVGDLASYRAFGEAVGIVERSLSALLDELKAQGKRIAAYGAAAKGSTLLNCCGIGTSRIDFVVDRSDLKQGLFLPGVHVPIRAPEALLEERPDYVLLLAWNFADEIMEQQRTYTEAGGRFILPVPRPRIV